MFNSEAGVDILNVPYRGTAPALAAILAGEVQIIVDASTTVLTHIEAGKVRALAVTGSERFSKLPDVPTAAEVGYPKLVAPFWLGVVAPAGTPPAIVDTLNAAFREALAAPEVQARLAGFGAEIKIGTPADFGKLLTNELAQWSAVAKAANIKAD
jgi:tripartite-type tricarboxylate transporter receptor subunit TctC